MFSYMAFGDITPVMEDQMEKKLQIEMKSWLTGIWGL